MHFKTKQLVKRISRLILEDESDRIQVVHDPKTDPAL